MIIILRLHVYVSALFFSTFLWVLTKWVFWGSGLLKCLKHDIVKYLTIHYFSIYLSSSISFSGLSSSFFLYPFLNLSLNSYLSICSPHPPPNTVSTAITWLVFGESSCLRHCAVVERLRLDLLAGPTICCPSGTTLAPYAGHRRVAWGPECSRDGRWTHWLAMHEHALLFT